MRANKNSQSELHSADGGRAAVRAEGRHAVDGQAGDAPAGAAVSGAADGAQSRPGTGAAAHGPAASARPRKARARAAEPRPRDPAGKNTVQSLAKGFRVLEAFRAERPELVLAEVARAAGLDNATAFRLLGTLAGLGYVEKIEGTRRFRLTLKCLDLGFDAIARTDLRALARPLLRAIVGARVEAASVGVLDGAEIVYVERVHAGLARLGIDVRIGSRIPAYSSAVGQAILSRLPHATRVAVLEARPRARLTATTVTALDDLLARLDRVAAQGFALSDQENVTGLRTLAAPVVDADGFAVAALSATAPAYTMTLAEFDAAGREGVVAAAARLSRALQAAGTAAVPLPRIP